ncbi:UNVERIFIED_CONTAM: hypothetical protein NY100_02200 [Prevotella sp. 15_C9]
MIRQDYFLRIIEEFTAAVALFLEKKEDDRDAGMRDLYRQYVGDYELLRNMTVRELVAFSLEQWKPEERIRRLGMLAELLYVEGGYKVNPLRAMLLDKALLLYEYVDARSDTYSIDRKMKMQKLADAVTAIEAKKS